LHHIDDNTVWSADEIDRRKAMIESAGLSWSVVESIPIPSIIKQGGAAAQRAIGVWKDSLANVGRAGIPVVCYNFMPVVDWTRTDLLFRLPTTGYALRFDMIDFIGYDAFESFGLDNCPRHHCQAAKPHLSMDFNVPSINHRVSHMICHIDRGYIDDHVFSRRIS
jgi:D-mannonate dehydratase